MKTSSDSIPKLEAFIAKNKFVEDGQLDYTGLGDPNLQPIMNEKVNQAAGDFLEVAQSPEPKAEKYQEKIGIGLARFHELYLDLDSEDRERVCIYFEELMDIVGLESSAGQLNDFLYDFDPS